MANGFCNPVAYRRTVDITRDLRVSNDMGVSGHELHRSNDDDAVLWSVTRRFPSREGKMPDDEARGIAPNQNRR